jgi:hypothetical protein
MTTAWTSSGSVSGSNENHLMTRQPCFVSDHPLELPKRPSMELRTLLSTATLTTIADTAQVFQHNQAIGWKTIDEATANGMQVVACPTAFLVAEPCPSPFGSRAFALQNTPSGTEPLAPLYQLHTRNLDTVRSSQQVNLTEIDTNDVLWRVAGFGDKNRNSNMQVEFTVPITLENCKCGFRRSENWEIALSDFDSALDSFTITSGDAHPDYIAFPEQSEKTDIQIQRLGFENQQLDGLLFRFEGLVCFCNTLTGAEGIISVEVEPLSDVVVSSVVQSHGMEAALGKCDLTDSVAGVGEDIQRSFQTPLIFRRQVEFRDNGQFHRLYYTAHARICQEILVGATFIEQ